MDFNQSHSSIVLSAGGNTCFYGNLNHSSDKSKGVCADGVRLEGTIIMWLPEKVKLQSSVYPWTRIWGVTAR